LLVVELVSFFHCNKPPTQLPLEVARKLKDAIADFLAKIQMSSIMVHSGILILV